MTKEEFVEKFMADQAKRRKEKEREYLNYLRELRNRVAKRGGLK